MTEPELQTLARNIHHGRVVTSIGARNSGDLARRFVALAFAKPELLEKIKKSDPGMFYRDASEVGSAKWLSQEETRRMGEILAELAAREI